MKILLNVDTIFCYDCVMALRKFIGSEHGVESVEVADGKVAIEFNPAEISIEVITRLAKDNIEKLGYRVLE
jgi:copper chaperone CopZ